MGSQGFCDAVQEVKSQSEEMGQEFTDIVLACGSGGTVAGLVEGLWRSKWNKGKITAYSVCDSPEYFYEFIEQEILPKDDARPKIKELLEIKCAKGIGYALATEDELEFICKFARLSGIVLDPVYTGKAFFAMIRDLAENPDPKRSVLFWHTGGSLGMFAQTHQLEKILAHQTVTELLD